MHLCEKIDLGDGFSKVGNTKFLNKLAPNDFREHFLQFLLFYGESFTEKCREKYEERFPKRKHSFQLLFAKLLNIYPLYEEKINCETRESDYTRIKNIVRRGGLHPGCLIPFFTKDSETSLVATAAFDYSLNCPLFDEDPLTGPQAVFECITNGSMINPVAGVGGLIMLGDSRVIKMLEPLREKLIADDLPELRKCNTGFITISVVEFYLQWLESLSAKADKHLAVGLAHLLYHMAANSTNNMATEILVNFPAGNCDPRLILKSIPLLEYGKNLLPRFKKLAKGKNLGNEVMRDLIEIWSGK